MKCDLCKKDIEEAFLGKAKGSIVKMKQGEKNKIYNVCSECQKKYGKSIKEEVAKIN